MKRFIELYNQYRGLSRTAYVLFFSRMVTNMGAFIWPMLTMILSRKMGYDKPTIAILTIAVGLIYMPAQIIGGRLADRFDNKKLIIVLDSLSILLFISCGFVGINNWMLVLFVAAGVFASMEGPAFDALIAKATKPFERDRVFSLAYLGMNLGLVLGATVGGFLFEDHLSWAFVIDGLTTLSSTILIILFVKEIDTDTLEAHEKNEYEDGDDQLTTWQYFTSQPSILMSVGIILLSQFIYNQWTFIIPLHLESLFESEGAKLLGFLTSFNAAIVVFFTPVITYLLRRRTELQKMAIGIALFGGSFILLAISEQLAMFFVMIFIFTVGEITNSIGGAPYISRRVPNSHRGRVGSIIGLTYMFGMMFGRLTTGFTMEYWGYQPTYLLLVAVTLLAVVVINKTLQVDRRQFPVLYEKFVAEQARLDAEKS